MDFYVSDLLLTAEEFDKLKEKNVFKVASYTNEAMALFTNSDFNSELGVGLFLSKNLKNGLLKNKTNSLLTVTEEISHIIYTIFKANNEIPVSAFELETQAEIDKYVVMVRRFVNNGINIFNLPEYIYSCLHLSPNLNSEQHRRYSEAMSTAYTFIKEKIHNDFLEKRDSKAIKMLQQIYRLSGTKKLSVLKGEQI